MPTFRLPPTIKQLLTSSNVSNNLQVFGWVKSIRRQKKVTFAMISDGSTMLQAVFQPTDKLSQITNGSAVRLQGQLVQSIGPEQLRELQVDDYEVLGACDPETYPIQKQALTTDYLRDNCHLRARVDKMKSMLHMRHTARKALQSFFEEQDFHHVDTPITTSNDCEGGGETFTVSAPSTSPSPESTDFFSRPAYLTVSAQLHLEALASSFSRVYTLSPCFRAERSQTNRHLAEFWMLEAEWVSSLSTLNPLTVPAESNDAGNSAADNPALEELCAFVEAMTRHTVLACIHESTDMQLLWKYPSTSISSPNDHSDRFIALRDAVESAKPWPRTTYTTAIDLLSSSSQTFQFAPTWGKPLQSEHERYLSDVIFKGPVFVTDYPASIKPFYMRLNRQDLNYLSRSNDRQTVACFDLLIPHLGELAGGSLREERLAFLQAALKHHNLPAADYTWYEDLRKYGSAPHGGFGMGFERLISWLTGMENVRECIPMPRWSGRMLL